MARFAEKADSSVSAREVLTRYRLIESRNAHAVPTLAALLLFGRNPSRWHERCGIEFVRWQGAERKSGAELNITKRFRIDAPLAAILEKAFQEIKPHIRERQQLHDLFFVETLEYPTFAWQEAIVNAVAHRDYSIRGLGIEIGMFDDRIEIRSPGLPPSPVTLEALAARSHLHCSRNPLIVRVLTVMGYMRELGEGVPRMFEEMERAGYYPPAFDAIGGAVLQVKLRNEPIYDRATLEWLTHFKYIELTGDQKRILAYAHAHGDRFTSREYQSVLKTDIYGASAAIKDLIRKDVAVLPTKGGKVYMVREPLQAIQEMPKELAHILPALRQKGKLANSEVRLALGLSRMTAARLLKELVAARWLRTTGKRGAGAFYSAGPRLLNHSPFTSEARKTDPMGSKNDSMKP